MQFELSCGIEEFILNEIQMNNLYSPDSLTAGFDTVQKRPPHTGKMAPVVKDAASEARNKMALDTSSTVPTRPRGCASAQEA